MSCTDVGPFDGGIYVEPQIQQGTVISSTIENSTIQGTVTLDNTAATSILEALQEQSPTVITDAPRQNDGNELPTTIVGQDRTVVMGKPAAFMKFGNYMIPMYLAE